MSYLKNNATGLRTPFPLFLKNGPMRPAQWSSIMEGHPDPVFWNVTSHQGALVFLLFTGASRMRLSRYGRDSRSKGMSWTTRFVIRWCWYCFCVWYWQKDFDFSDKHLKISKRKKRGSEIVIFSGDCSRNCRRIIGNGKRDCSRRNKKSTAASSKSNRWSKCSAAAKQSWIRLFPFILKAPRRNVASGHKTSFSLQSPPHAYHISTVNYHLRLIITFPTSSLSALS